METRAQSKQRKNAIACQSNKIRGLRVVLKRLSDEELQTHDVSNSYNFQCDIFSTVVMILCFRLKFQGHLLTQIKQTRIHANASALKKLALALAKNYKINTLCLNRQLNAKS